MARQVAVLVLVFMALIGLACAGTALESTIAPVSSSDAVEAPDSTIGAIDEGTAPSGNDNVEAAPLGGPVPPGAFSQDAPAPSPGQSGAATLKASAIAAVAVAAVAGHFL